MRRYGLGILAIVSLLIAGMGSLGYFGRFAGQAGHYRLMGREGCITLVHFYSPAFAEYGIHWQPELRRLKLKECLWGFRNDREVMVNANIVYVSSALTTFPIWCVLLPCSIAPLMWIRRRRKQKTRGFPVEPAVIAQ